MQKDISMYLSWIIPAYNEEKRIAKTVREVDAYLKSKQLEGGHEIIVADSSSRDRTQEIVRELAKEFSSLHLFSVENRGKGWAVREGMRIAKGEILLFSDADNATSPDHFDTMVPFFRQGYEVVISSRSGRDVPGARQEVPESLLRRFAGKAGNLIIQLLAVRGIWDTQNGFKAFRKDAAVEIFSRLTVDGFAFDIEVLALARRLGYRIGVIPVRWRHSPESKVTLRSYFQVLVDVVKIRWNVMTNHYAIPRSAS